MSRRVCLLALFVGSFLLIGRLRVPDAGLAWPEVGNAVKAAEPSGALAPAPLNASFDQDPDPALQASPAGRAGKVEPPGWRVAAGTARVETDAAGRKYALLDTDNATLVTSPFTVTRTLPVLTFEYSFPSQGRKGNALEASVLSGPNFANITRVKTEACPCARDRS